MSDAIAELLLRFELGDFPANVRKRLQQIISSDPPDALDRLKRACTHLSITGITPGTLERANTLCSRSTEGQGSMESKKQLHRRKREQ